MAKSKSSKIWLHEHNQDIYVQRRTKEGQRARSVYKLEEIQARYKILKSGYNVVDLGAAPGSWAEYAAKIVGATGSVVAVDLLPITPIPNVTFYQGDFTDKAIKNKILEHFQNKQADVILSDMAPNLSGIAIADQARSIELAEAALTFALETLKPNGTFLVKVFQGEDFPAFYKKMQQAFSSVKTIKPDASRSRSKEIYLLANSG